MIWSTTWSTFRIPKSANIKFPYTLFYNIFENVNSNTDGEEKHRDEDLHVE